MADGGGTKFESMLNDNESMTEDIPMQWHYERGFQGGWVGT